MSTGWPHANRPEESWPQCPPSIHIKTRGAALSPGTSLTAAVLEIVCIGTPFTTSYHHFFGKLVAMAHISPLCPHAACSRSGNPGIVQVIISVVVVDGLSCSKTVMEVNPNAPSWVRIKLIPRLSSALTAIVWNGKLAQE